MNENELRQLLIDNAVDYCDCDGHIIPSLLAKVITNAGYRKIQDGAVVLFLTDEKSKQAAEQFIELGKTNDLREIVFVSAQEYSDPIEARRNYEYAKGKIEELQTIIDKQNQQKIGLAKAYTNARKETSREILKEAYIKLKLKENCGYGEYQDGIADAEIIIEEIAKKYGVEVEE